jgi:hypothetical protein
LDSALIRKTAGVLIAKGHCLPPLANVSFTDIGELKAWCQV